MAPGPPGLVDAVGIGREELGHNDGRAERGHLSQWHIQTGNLVVRRPERLVEDLPAEIARLDIAEMRLAVERRGVPRL